MKYWEIIADNLSKAGWSCGCVSAIDAKGRRIFVAPKQRVPADAFRPVALIPECRLMKNFDPADGVNFFTGQTPDLAAMWVRRRSIMFMHRIVKEPTGDHHALV